MKKTITYKALYIMTVLAILFILMPYERVASKVNSKPRPPFWRDIEEFKRQDRKSPPPECSGQVQTDTFLRHQVKFFVFIGAEIPQI